MPKILQTDNGKEFDNQYIKHYYIENDLKLIHSSPYHPQTNGSVEVTHKEIQKYIFNPLASPSAGAPALKYGDVNTVTPSPGEVKGLMNT